MVYLQKGMGNRMDTIKMAILGAGNIAHSMAATIAQMPAEVVPYAVAARDAKRAEVFAQQYGFTKWYGSYEEMVQDDEIDLVYIATPHSHHARHATLCINHGKHVLCEKAFTANAEEAMEVLDLAHRSKVFITEGMWPRYTPQARILRELVQDGDAVGRVSMLSACMGAPLQHVQRMADPALAGGALLDLSVYPLNFASIAFGDDIHTITSNAVKLHTGVDAMNCITLRYRDGRMANLNSNMTAAMDNSGTLYGEDGFIVVPNLANYGNIQVFGKNKELKAEYPQPPQKTGYEYEVLACVKALREKRLECPEMPHSETLRIMQLMDDLREEWGIYFPFETNANAAL